jgi:peptide-methionine (S)-S-oxide reductase
VTCAAKSETAVLAGGCFWCIEAVYREVEGVSKAVSGYTGGTVRNPGYQQVCTDDTGHAEAVQLTFDPAKISYREILEIFFSVHDPTTANRQGADAGIQYRSAIFYQDEAQKEAAANLIAELDREKIWGRPIVTQVVPAVMFYPAEEYHQEYFSRHPEQAYCQAIISPKLAKFRRKWAHLLKR